MARPNIKLIESSPEYAEAWFRWRNQATAVNYMPLESSSPHQLAERLRATSSNLSDRTSSEFKWFIQFGAEVVGLVGLTSVRWRMGYAEITYMLDSRFHRQGIAAAGVSKMVDRVFGETELYRIFATVSDGNIPSINLLRKLEFIQEGCLREHYVIQGKRVDQLVFGLLRPEWAFERNADPA